MTNVTIVGFVFEPEWPTPWNYLGNVGPHRWRKPWCRPFFFFAEYDQHTGPLGFRMFVRYRHLRYDLSRKYSYNRDHHDMYSTTVYLSFVYIDLVAF